MVDDNVFAVLPEGRRTWAVASIYGEASRLVRLHGLLADRIQVEDNLVYLGNILGHGVEVLACVQEILTFRVALMAHQAGGEAGEIAYLRGSQEEMWQKLLQVQFAPQPRQVLEWMLRQGVAATLAAYGGTVAEGISAANRGAVALSQWTNRLRARMRALDGHDRLMTALRRAAYTNDGKLLFVNAGIDPNRPLSQQRDAFWWEGRRFESLTEPYNGFRRVIRGADSQRRGFIVTDVSASLDGGCGFGGPLIAACFDDAGNPVDVIEA